MRYHKRFRSIHPRTVKATKHLFVGWKNLTDAQRFDRSRQWLEEVSAIYQMRTPTLVIDDHADKGCYFPRTNSIHMAYPSVVTLAHEFRHAFQSSHPSRMVDDVEDDARAWSLSLYYKVAPRTMRTLVAEGKILFVALEDIA